LPEEWSIICWGVEITL